MSAFIENEYECDECSGQGHCTHTYYDHILLKNGPVVCKYCFGTGHILTALGRDLARFLEMWEKRKK